MAQDNTSLSQGLNFQIDPELLKEAERLQAMQQAQAAQNSIPELQAPELTVTPEDIQGMTQPAPQVGKEEMMAQIRERLMKRMSQADPENLAAEKAAALEGAKPGTDVKIARALSEFFGGMSGQKSNLGMFGKQDKEARAEASKPFEEKSAQQAKDEQLFQQFEAMDMKKKYQSLQEANLIANTDQKEFNSKLMRAILGTDEQMNDPSSSQSQQAKVLFKEMTGKEAPEGSTSLSLYPVVKDASKYYRSKANALVDYAKEQRGVTRDIAKEDRAKAAKLAAPTEGEKTIDREFAKDYNEWESTGRGTYQKNIDRLKKAKKQLEDNEGVLTSGRVAGALPDWARTEQSKVIQQDVQGAAQGALKATLGSAFTEKEGERIMKDSYDPTLEGPANIEKIDRAIKNLEANAASFDKRAAYFRDNRSLKGYPASGTSGGNSAAEQWLKENPNHPKADAVRKKLGL